MFIKRNFNKYGAQKTVFNGITYDSKKESRRGAELEFLQRVGQISNLQRQVSFVLQDGFVNNKGEKIRPITYIADFVYEQDGKMIVEDVKSKATITEVYKIKRKLFMHKFPGYFFYEKI